MRIPARPASRSADNGLCPMRDARSDRAVMAGVSVKTRGVVACIHNVARVHPVHAGEYRRIIS